MPSRNTGSSPSGLAIIRLCRDGLNREEKTLTSINGRALGGSRRPGYCCETKPRNTLSEPGESVKEEVLGRSDSGDKCSVSILDGLDAFCDAPDFVNNGGGPADVDRTEKPRGWASTRGEEGTGV